MTDTSVTAPITPDELARFPLSAKQCSGPAWTHCASICTYCLRAWREAEASEETHSYEDVSR